MTYEQLMSLYSKKKDYFGFGAAPKLACAVIESVTVLLLSLLALFFYARFRTAIGGEIFYGETMSLPRFLLLSLREFYEAEEDMDSGMTTDLFMLMRAPAAAAAAMGAAAVMIVAISKAAWRLFSSKKPLHDLPVTLLRGLYVPYLVNAFLTNVSGGVGNGFYSVGYVSGAGMDIGMIVGTLALLSCGVILLCSEKRRVGEGVRIFLELAVCIAILALLAEMPLYSAIGYFLSSALLAFAASVSQESFAVQGFAYPLLNLLVFAGVMGVYFGCMKTAVGRCGELFRIEEKTPAKARGKKFPSVMCFLGAICALAATLVLRIPSIGYGWEVDVLPQIVACCVLAAFALTVRLASLTHRDVEKHIE